MIPGQGALEQGHVILPQHQPGILLCRTTRNVDHREPAINRRGQGRAARLGDVHGRDRRDRECFSALARLHDLVIDERTAPQDRVAHAIGQRVVQPSRHRLATLDQRDDDPERRMAVREIMRTVDRVDDPDGAVVDALDQCRVRCHRFLADDAGLRQDRGQPGAEPALALLVSDRHQLARRLLDDLMLRQILVMVEHHLARDGADQGRHGGVESLGHVSGIITFLA